MKWIVFLAGVVCVAILTIWFRNNPRKHLLFWTVFGSLPFILSAVPRSEIAIVGWPEWPGMTRGIEVSFIDLIGIGIYISLPRSSIHPTPFRLSMGFYFVTVLLSVFSAQVPMASIFYLSQLGRVFLLYALVAKASAADQRVIFALLRGMALGLMMQAFVVVVDRTAFGAVQASGTFGHQNLLGMISHFVVFPFFALLLAGERGVLAILAPLAGAIIAIGGASRATIGLAGLGFVGAYVLTALARWTGRKARIGFVGLLLMSVLGTVAMSSLERRFEFSPLIEDEYDERVILISVAEAMLARSPMGVGANNFAVVSNTQGYADRAGVAPQRASRAALVHNVYWLTLAECGFLGLAGLLVLLAHPLIVGLRAGWKNRKNKGGELMLGCATSLGIVYVHSYFEWIFFTSQVQYLFAMTVGIMAGLGHKLGYWDQSRYGGGNVGNSVPASRHEKLFNIKE